MEDKEYYTQTEIATALGKSLSNLAFYKGELRDLGYLVMANNREMITKDGFNYLKLRFAGQLEKKHEISANTSKQEAKKEQAETKNTKNLPDKNKPQEEKISNENNIAKFTEKDLEIEKLKMEKEALLEKNKDLNTQILKWENECKAWQKNVDKTNEDKQFWQDFATKELGNLKDRLLPESTEVIPTSPPEKKGFFSKIFKK